MLTDYIYVINKGSQGIQPHTLVHFGLIPCENITVTYQNMATKASLIVLI